MMISSDALHLGPLMLPWALLIVATGLMLLSAILIGLARKSSWSKRPAWTKVARIYSGAVFCWGCWVRVLFFVLFNAELYFAAPIDILKIRIKVFIYRERGLIARCFVVCHSQRTSCRRRFKAILLIIFVLSIGLGLAFKSSVKTEVAFPDLVFAGLEQERLGTDKVSLSQFIGQPTVINMWPSCMCAVSRGNAGVG